MVCLSRLSSSRRVSADKLELVGRAVSTVEKVDAVRPFFGLWDYSWISNCQGWVAWLSN